MRYIFHIRRRLRKARGNSFYKDYSDRGRGTFCGAPETEFDIAWAERNRARDYELNGAQHVACESCKRARDAEKITGTKP